MADTQVARICIYSYFESVAICKFKHHHDDDDGGKLFKVELVIQYYVTSDSFPLIMYNGAIHIHWK